MPGEMSQEPPSAACAAVDTRTGQLELFDSHSGVTLLEAVAASCAVPVAWPPITHTFSGPVPLSLIPSRLRRIRPCVLRIRQRVP
ncbi:hypothetical protein CW362_19985 [Streptomyces populi]|uniref:Uncharacterized protein n=1 Tax=Streptomyces populi TaxID=2058924 RepID=A0A2I0SN22_9ACTN|nr:hypothetical protein CW362_19985 [Streptomyces populi]